jgi:hypothetical protein
LALVLATIPNLWPPSGRLQLADVSQRLLDAAAARLETAGSGSQVMGVSLRSATDTTRRRSVTATRPRRKNSPHCSPSFLSR